MMGWASPNQLKITQQIWRFPDEEEGILQMALGFKLQFQRFPGIPADRSVLKISGLTSCTIA